jgi:hypothetical protein
MLNKVIIKCIVHCIVHLQCTLFLSLSLSLVYMNVRASDISAWVWGQRKMRVKYRACLGCWISPCYGPFSLGTCFETYEKFISLISQFFCGEWGCGRGSGKPGSSVGIATGYRLDGPGIESRWGRDFLHTSRPALGPTEPPVQ